MKYLYITYDGLLDPLGQSQILPYIYGINSELNKFVIISYEKEQYGKKKILQLNETLKGKGIKWYRLTFNRNKFNVLKRFLLGALLIRYIILKHSIRIVHLRGGYSALIFKLSLSKVNYIYDIRAFWGQWADGGRTSNGSFLDRILKKFDDQTIKNAAGIVVLDKSGKEYLDKKYKLEIPIKTISTSTNIDKFKLSTKSSTKKIRFVHLGGGRFPPYNVYEVMKFVNNMISNKIDCTIDFINKGDHELIEKERERCSFPIKNFSIKSYETDEIYEYLGTYDCGFVFLSRGEWIRMSSPTKIGEYLSAGLYIIGNKGNAAMERLAAESSSVEIINNFDGEIMNNYKSAHELFDRIKNQQVSFQSRKLAYKYYSLEKAVCKYNDLYKEIRSYHFQ